MTNYINERNVYFTGNIDEESSAWLINQINDFNIKDDKEDEVKKDYKRLPITIHISSYGGSAYEALAIIDIIETSKTEINTICVGKCMSAGFIIFLAGKNRKVMKRATFMCHSLAHGVKGKLYNMINTVQEDVRLQGVVDTFILDKTGIKKDILSKVNESQKDWYIDAEESLNLGISHEIM